MDQESTIEKAIREILVPIIEGAVEKALARHQQPSGENQATFNEILDVNGVAEYLNLTKATIYSMTHKREIVHYKRGKKLYFYKSDMDDFISQGRVKTMEEIEQEATDYIIRRKRHKY